MREYLSPDGVARRRAVPIENANFLAGGTTDLFRVLRHTFVADFGRYSVGWGSDQSKRLYGNDSRNITSARVSDVGHIDGLIFELGMNAVTNFCALNTMEE